jgi:hypothetical protein
MHSCNLLFPIYSGISNWRLLIGLNSLIDRNQTEFDILGLIEELTYEIDVWFQEKYLTNNALDLDLKLHLLGHIYVWLGHCFKAVLLPYLLLIRRTYLTKDNHKLNWTEISNRTQSTYILLDYRFTINFDTQNTKWSHYRSFPSAWHKNMTNTFKHKVGFWIL